jgi:hypothetical protein
MHFTKPTAKSYIYDAHLSQQEMLQLLMRHGSIKPKNILSMRPGLDHFNALVLHNIENIGTAVACTILMLSLPPAAEYVAMQSAEHTAHKTLNQPSSTINALHVYSDEDDDITIAPVYI